MTTFGWLWIYAGLGLMLLELVAPGFVICFFGLSAITVGALRLAFGDAFSATWQAAAFSLFSIVYIVLLRRWIKSVFVGETTKKSPADETLAGRLGCVTEPVSANIPGRVIIGDSEWNAIAGESIPAGANVRVVSQNNLTLTVEPV